MTKQRIFTRSKNQTSRRWGRVARWGAIAGIVLSSFFGSCTPKTDKITPIKKDPPKTRCYGYEEKKLRVHFEDRKKGNVLGTEHILDLADLKITDKEGNTNPLAYFCTYSGHLLWVTSDKIFVRKINLDNGKINVKKDDQKSVFEIKHFLPTEYKWAGKRISADIWRAPNQDWEGITIATLTEKGVLQFFRLNQSALADRRPDRGFYDFAQFNSLKKDDRWPKEIKTAFLHIIDSEEFVVFPIGTKGKGSVNFYYHGLVKGKKGISFREEERRFSVRVMEYVGKNEGLHNVFEIVKPLRLDIEEGGIIVDMTGEKKTGEPLNIITIIKAL